MSRSLPDDAVLDLNESAAVASNNLDRSVVSPSAGATSAAFHGILFDQPGMSLAKEQPAAFGDLNLDQVVEGATNGREQYELKPVYYTHLPSADGIDFRQAVFRDLERPDTHLFTLAHGLWERHASDAMFLRAQRRPDGTRTYILEEGEPLQTSFGRDLYERIFTHRPPDHTAGVVPSSPLP